MLYRSIAHFAGPHMGDDDDDDDDDDHDDDDVEESESRVMRVHPLVLDCNEQ